MSQADKATGNVLGNCYFSQKNVLEFNFFMNPALCIHQCFKSLWISVVNAVLSYVYSKQPIFGLTQEWLRELSFSRLECGVHDRLHSYPLCGIFYFPWQRHQIEGTNGFYCLIRKTKRYTISNVASQVFTPNNAWSERGSNPDRWHTKRTC